MRPLASFRITFGVKDEKTRSWDGEVIPSAGQQLQIEADRFRNHDFMDLGRYLDQERFADFPNDRVLNETSWICATRLASMFVMRGNKAPPPIIQQPTLLVHVRGGSLDEPIRVKTVAGEFAFRPREIVEGRPVSFLDGSVLLEAVPRVARVAAERAGTPDFPALLSARSGLMWLAWQEYDGATDSVVVRSLRGEDWAPATVLAEKVDAFQIALGEDAAKRIWTVWSMQVNGNWDLYGRTFDGKNWSKQEQLTRHAGTDFYHKLITDSEGRLWLVWQRRADGFSQILAKYFDGRKWSEEEQISMEASASGNNWWPAVAAGPGGSLAVAWDGYASGNFDVYLRRREGNRWGKVETVAGTARYEAQPTVAIDPAGRVWVAWNESGPNWGKDTGFLVIDKGTQLYESRAVRIACLDGGRWMTTVGALPAVSSEEEYWQMPHLQMDVQGRPCLIVRHLLMRRPGTPREQPTNAALWEAYLTRYDGARWSELTYLPRGTGRNDMMPGTAIASDGRLWGVWTTDSRTTKSYQLHHFQIQLGAFGESGPGVPLALKPFEVEPNAVAPLDPHEAANVRRARTYRVQHNGKTYSIYRGDLHRHSDISIDGAHDGSLLDAYRYAHDAAALDFLGMSNHVDGLLDAYDWYRNKKVADLFQVRGAFTTFYGYERSVEFPNGHRNAFFIKRGAEMINIDGSEGSAEEGSERLYAYLHQMDGFCIAHTTGRTSGTDWRNNDPVVESLVEIYQGERDVYEYPGGPKPKRLWSQWLDPAKPIPIESSQENSRTYRSQGFVSNALAKGYKLGFIASSDHISTHVGYACLIAEELTREGLVEAVRARRSYAATDNIVLDIRHHGSDGEHLMGEIFASSTPVRIQAKIFGTGEIQQVDIMKDGTIVQTYKPGTADFNFEYQDPQPKKGESYYYVRVIQKSGDMAWGSPVWVTYP